MPRHPTPSDPRALVETLRDALADFSDIRLAVLFGSAARGEDRPESDLDLGVLLDPYDVGRFWPIDLASNRALRRVMDVVDLNEAPPLLRLEVARDGLVVIERGEHTWVDFKARAMIDWWDWRPTAKMIERITAEKLREEVENGSS